MELVRASLSVEISRWTDTVTKQLYPPRSSSAFALGSFPTRPLWGEGAVQGWLR